MESDSVVAKVAAFVRSLQEEIQRCSMCGGDIPPGGGMLLEIYRADTDLEPYRAEWLCEPCRTRWRDTMPQDPLPPSGSWSPLPE
jgi:hypothetical protein